MNTFQNIICNIFSLVIPPQPSFHTLGQSRLLFASISRSLKFSLKYFLEYFYSQQLHPLSSSSESQTAEQHGLKKMFVLLFPQLERLQKKLEVAHFFWISQSLPLDKRQRNLFWKLTWPCYEPAPNGGVRLRSYSLFARMHQCWIPFSYVCKYVQCQHLCLEKMHAGSSEW